MSLKQTILCVFVPPDPIFSFLPSTLRLKTMDHTHNINRFPALWLEVRSAHASGVRV